MQREHEGDPSAVQQSRPAPAPPRQLLAGLQGPQQVRAMQRSARNAATAAAIGANGPVVAVLAFPQE